MAGTVTETGRASNVFNEIIVTLACTSDASAGTIPDTNLTGLEKYELKEVVNINPASAQPSTAYLIAIEDADGLRMFTSPTSRSVTASAAESTGGHETLGWYPRVDGTITVKFRTAADDGAADVGNSKTLTVRLRFERKRGN